MNKHSNRADRKATEELEARLRPLADTLRQALGTESLSPELDQEIYNLIQTLPGKSVDEQRRVIERALELAGRADAR